VLKREDKPLLYALLAIVLALGLNVVASSEEHQEHRGNNPADNEPSGIPNWLWGATEAFATGAIAIFAFVQIRDSRISSERQLRAYVFPDTRKVHAVDPGQEPWLEVVIRNSGKTPAYKFKQACRGGYQDYPMSGSIPDTRDEENETMPLGPGEDTIATPRAPALTAGRIALIAKGEKALYFTGQIDFVDALGHPRWVKYCFYSGGNIPLGDVAFYKQGNSTSEDEVL
jgi:hypothetical protein